MREVHIGIETQKATLKNHIKELRKTIFHLQSSHTFISEFFYTCKKPKEKCQATLRHLSEHTALQVQKKNIRNLEKTCQII